VIRDDRQRQYFLSTIKKFICDNLVLRCTFVEKNALKKFPLQRCKADAERLQAGFVVMRVVF
jgi:hypothetical protein